MSDIPSATPAPRPETHGPTALVCDILGELLTHGGWSRASDVAERVGCHRDNARRVLDELARRDWVRVRQGEDGANRYALGPALPAIGHAYLQLLAAEQARLKADFDRATIPYTWTSGPRGPEFRPSNPQNTEEER